MCLSTHSLELDSDQPSIRDALKDFSQPLRSNNTRADFFAVYREESEEFDRDYARKYDEDLNTSLIFVSRQMCTRADQVLNEGGWLQAGLFSAVSSAFIIDVQPNLQSDSNDMTTAYMRILIHTMNESLFPDADQLATVWTGPSVEIVTVLCLLYASLATSLFAAFVAMLGKQWVNRYIRNHGGSAEEKSWGRQRKLDGMEQWHFHVVMEAIPVMLQVALALLGSGLSLYLWSINRTVAGIVMAMVLFGFSYYIFLTLAAIFVYNCPYQTPPSYAIQSLVRYILCRHHGVVNPLSLIFRVLKNTGLTFARLFKRLRSAMFTLCRSPSPVVGPEDIPLAAVVEPTRIFDGALADSTNHEVDARCVAWVLYFTTDKDVILPSVRFAADIALYPAIATIVPTHVLTDLFFECFTGWEIAAGKLDQARSAGMALASVLSVQLCLDPGSQMRELLERMPIMDWFRMEDHTANLVVDTLCLVAGSLPQLFQGCCLAYPDNPDSGAIRRLDFGDVSVG